MPSGRVPAVPIPFDVARTGEEQIGAGLTGLGQGLANIGQMLTRIELEKQQARNEAAFSNAISQFDDFQFAQEQAAKNRTYANTEEFNESRIQYEKSWKKRIDEISKGLNSKVAEQFNDYSVKLYAVKRRQMESVIFDKETNFHRAQFAVDYRKALEQGHADRLSVIKESYKRWFDPDQMELSAERENIYFNTKIGNYNTALELIDKSKMLTNQEQISLRNYVQENKGSVADQFAKDILAVILDADRKNLSGIEKENLALDLKSRIPRSALSGEQARTWFDYIEKWSKDKTENNSIVYTNLFRDVTQLHRGIGKAEKVRKSITDAFSNLDPAHFESLNKYLDETVEEWNADTLRRLEKEAIPHLAPRLSMLERFIEMAATPGISAQEKAKYDSLIERLREPAKVDADRLALYLDQSRKWIAANPTAPNFYENGRRIMAQFERYTDDQIRQMEKQLESETGLEMEISTTTKTWKYTIINRETGQRMGSDDGAQWTPIQ